MSTYKDILCIINPASGSDEPILRFINTAIKQTQSKWKTYIPQKAGDIYQYINKKLTTQPDLIIVYGGDGSVTEAAQALCGTDIPLLILPGGTANVVAKEVALPATSQEVLQLFTDNKLVEKKIDMARCNDSNFLIRVNYGIFASMINQAQTEQKASLGSLAYALSAAAELGSTEPITFQLEIDGQNIREDAIGLMVTNVGNAGIANISLHPNISINDGLLDVLIVRDKNISTILSLANTTLFQAQPSSGFVHYQGRNISITAAKTQTVIYDDVEAKLENAVFTSKPLSLKVLTTHT